MITQKLFDFLTDLQQNNHKEWMDAHRDRYESVRDDFIAFLNEIDKRIQKIDPDYFPTPGKTAINRINNNLLYHPNKPVYKDHFGGSLDKKKGHCDFYIHIGISEIFIAGGFYSPSNDVLKRIRAAIDYDGERLKEIIHDSEFEKQFGELLQADKLKTAPKGFTQDHKHIDLLRLKHFVVSHELTCKKVLSNNFPDHVLDLYQTALPFRKYLNKAVSVAVEEVDL